MKIVLYIKRAISIKITGTLIMCKHWSRSAIGVVRVKNPKHEKHAKQRQNVVIPKSNEDCVTTIPQIPVSKITLPLPKKNIKNKQVITANIIGIVRNLIYDFTDTLATPKTRIAIKTKTHISKVKLFTINVIIINAIDTITLT